MTKHQNPTTCQMLHFCAARFSPFFTLLQPNQASIDVSKRGKKKVLFSGHLQIRKSEKTRLMTCPWINHVYVVFNLAGSLPSTATLLYYCIKRNISDPFVQKNDEALFNRFSCLCQSLGLASHRYVSKFPLSQGIFF